MVHLFKANASADIAISFPSLPNTSGMVLESLMATDSDRTTASNISAWRTRWAGEATFPLLSGAMISSAISPMTSTFAQREAIWLKAETAPVLMIALVDLILDTRGFMK